ncbi:hypothetical protein GCM10022198_08940 [Klugiella xanthotipulae]|uniref:Lipoprotein n=1 Tax=Klugiella xanthotipulae TaxID=244735 RepID=A0A543I650_9MICO|nr:hypothetical protein FB466_0842 [Klugiella xanthotipulae]
MAGVTGLLLAGCADPTTELADARTRWQDQDASSYTFTLAFTCGDEEERGTYDVEVTDGSVTNVATVGDTPRASFAELRRHAGRTIDGIFDLLEGSTETITEASFDGTTGIPQTISLSQTSDGSEGEECFALTNFATQ